MYNNFFQNKETQMANPVISLATKIGRAIQKTYTAPAKIITAVTYQGDIRSILIQKAAYNALQSTMTKVGDKKNSALLKDVFTHKDELTHSMKLNSVTGVDQEFNKIYAGGIVDDAKMASLKEMNKKYANVRHFDLQRLSDTAIFSVIAGSIAYPLITNFTKK
jgi:hypothetical protein